MPIRDVAAQVASLSNDYGATHGPHSPTAFELALYVGDPATDEGVEVAATTVLVDEDTGDETTVSNGYSRASVPNDGAHFPAPDADTGVMTSSIIAFPMSAAEYPDTVTHWLLCDSTTGAGWDSGQLPRDEQITVEQSGVTPRLRISLFYSGIDA